MKSLHINAISPSQNLFEELSNHLGDDTGYDTMNRFRQQTFYVASCVLQFMKNAFDPLTHPIQQTFKAMGMMDFLVSAMGCYDSVASFQFSYGAGCSG